MKPKAWRAREMSHQVEWISPWRNCACSTLTSTARPTAPGRTTTGRRWRPWAIPWSGRRGRVFVGTSMRLAAKEPFDDAE